MASLAATSAVHDVCYVDQACVLVLLLSVRRTVYVTPYVKAKAMDFMNQSRRDSMMEDETENSVYSEIVAVGSRVSVAGYECGGTVRFVGPHHAGKGPRVLVELDLPDGKNNGTIDGHVYAQVPEGHGVLVKPEKVAELPGSAGAGAAQNQGALFDRLINRSSKSNTAAPAVDEIVYDDTTTPYDLTRGDGVTHSNIEQGSASR